MPNRLYAFAMHFDSDNAVNIRRLSHLQLVCAAERSNELVIQAACTALLRPGNSHSCCNAEVAIHDSTAPVLRFNSGKHPRAHHRAAAVARSMRRDLTMEMENEPQSDANCNNSESLPYFMACFDGEQ